MDSKILVGVRCRPLSLNEALREDETFDYFKSDDPKAVYTSRSKYLFPHIFTPNATQEEIYVRLAKPLVTKLLDGFNATIMAYGQTGTGKTYTMGTEMESGAQVQSGIMQRVLESLFSVPGIKIRLSFVEIYREKAYDLLTPKRTKLSVIGFRAMDTAIKEVNSVEEAREVLQTATRSRRVGSTVANLQSSRSHAIATIFVTNTYGHTLQESKLNLVDLAGSEKVQVAGSPRNEGLAINCGLSHLTTVITYLRNGMAHIPFRNSTLTSLLQDSLGQNNYISLIACFNPKKADLEESEKTFDFASKCGRIKLVPVISNHNLTPFKTPLSTFRNKTYCGGSSEIFKKPMTPLNKTIASPVVYPAVKRKLTSLAIEKTPKLNESHTNPRAWEARESVDSNWSNVSTSTTISDSGDFEALMTALNESKRENNAFKQATEACMQKLQAQVEKFTQVRNRWSTRLATPSLDDSLEGVSSQESLEHRTDESQSFSLSSLEQTVVMGRDVEKSADDEEEMYALVTDRTDKVESPLMIIEHAITQAAPRRSMRLSIRPFQDLTNEENDRPFRDDIVFKTPQVVPRRSTRLSIRPFQDLTNEGNKRPSRNDIVFKIPQAVVQRDDCMEHESRRNDSRSVVKAPRRSKRLSLVPVRYTPEVEKKQKTVEMGKSENHQQPAERSTAEYHHQQRILKILQTGDTKELQKLPTVGPKTAMIIINHRDLYGKFTKIEEIKGIRGLTKTQIKKFLSANYLE